MPVCLFCALYGCKPDQLWGGAFPSRPSFLLPSWPPAAALGQWGTNDWEGRLLYVAGPLPSEAPRRPSQGIQTRGQKQQALLSLQHRLQMYGGEIKVCCSSKTLPSKQLLNRPYPGTSESTSTHIFKPRTCRMYGHKGPILSLTSPISFFPC